MTKVISKLAMLFIALLVGGVAYAGSSAGDLTTIVGNLEGNIKSLQQLLTIVSYISGIGFAIAGIVQFKAHKDNPAQIPLSKPIVYLAVGAGLLFLPSIISTAGQTVFAGDQTRADEGLN